MGPSRQTNVPPEQVRSSGTRHGIYVDYSGIVLDVLSAEPRRDSTWTITARSNPLCASKAHILNSQVDEEAAPASYNSGFHLDLMVLAPPGLRSRLMLEPASDESTDILWMTVT